MSTYIGLIGYPLKHSISPYFQQAALDHYRLDIRYEAWETGPAQLQAAVHDLRRPQNVGANVTVPYKEAVLPLLDKVDDLASSIGAVNTIVKRDDRLLGFNTDAYGFMEALTKEGHIDPEGKKVVMLGAGGVGRAAGFVLVQRRVASLAITDGIFERASALAENLVKPVKETSQSSKELKPKVTAFQWHSLSSARTLDNCDLIVHCTTIGMKDSPQEGQSPLSLEAIPKGVLVYDVVYNPSPTPLLRLAQKAGANILGGLPMLVYQGAASFKLWTGKEAPIDIMFNKARERLLVGKG
ncbi:MAG TPA: shikimate dehydrogenase [Dehalococcoidia bacterium]|nr:shikimate dehydrogenase [Dehalococcoidia bacterium]